MAIHAENSLKCILPLPRDKVWTRWCRRERVRSQRDLQSLANDFINRDVEIRLENNIEVNESRGEGRAKPQEEENRNVRL